MASKMIPFSGAGGAEARGRGSGGWGRAPFGRLGGRVGVDTGGERRVALRGGGELLLEGPTEIRGGTGEPRQLLDGQPREGGAHRLALDELGLVDQVQARLGG